MPTLPSGLTLGLSPEAIPEEMPVHWFECPDGHFWYEAPDVSLSPPPWSRDEPPSFQDFRHAPVPCDRSALAPFVRVMRRDPDGVWWWAGDTLADFPRYTVLDDADLAAWRAWLAWRDAAMLLLAEYWSEARDEFDVDRFHWIAQTGVLDVGAMSEVARAVWEAS